MGDMGGFPILAVVVLSLMSGLLLGCCVVWLVVCRSRSCCCACSEYQPVAKGSTKSKKKVVNRSDSVDGEWSTSWINQPGNPPEVFKQTSSTGIQPFGGDSSNLSSLTRSIHSRQNSANNTMDNPQQEMNELLTVPTTTNRARRNNPNASSSFQSLQGSHSTTSTRGTHRMQEEIEEDVEDLSRYPDGKKPEVSHPYTLGLYQEPHRVPDYITPSITEIITVNHARPLPNYYASEFSDFSDNES